MRQVTSRLISFTADEIKDALLWRLRYHDNPSPSKDEDAKWSIGEDATFTVEWTEVVE